MVTPAEKLAQSLEVMRVLQDQKGSAIRSADLPRNHRERLLALGFLRGVMKGWYIPTQELPVGIITSILGGPFFLWLLLRKDRCVSI